MKEQYDVVVAGGGPAGVAAAVSAARCGADTLLVEKAGYLGGMATDAHIPAFCTFTDGKALEVGGVGLEILQAMQARMWRSPFYDAKPGRDFAYDWVPIDTEILKAVLDALVQQSGCTLALHTTLAEVCREGRAVTALRLATPAGMCTVRAAQFIDCTGNALLAHGAGAECLCGDENGRVQAATLCFQIANFDTQCFLAYAKETGENGNLSKASACAIADGKFPAGETQVAGIALITPGTATLNFGHVFDFDPFTSEGMTRAELEARRALPELMAFLQEYVPGAENAVLIGSGPSIGIRESRRIAADYMLCRADYDRRADFDDAIGYYSYPIDLHAARQAEGAMSGHGDYESSRYAPGERYGIPYRSLIVRDLDNVLAAGRIIGADRAAQASVRVMPACFLTGQAAGTAAALCAKAHTDLRKLNIEQLKQTLKDAGAILQ
ncbi:MAG: FAD-dependent oxidoreductase [Subdoligranulum sp.]|nr:FAD-dependent oxidoreductase [Subdoligranulum sp.]